MKQHGFALAFLGGMLVIWCLGMAGVLALGAVRDPEPGRMVVLFGPKHDRHSAFMAVAKADGLVIGGGVMGRLWTVYGDKNDFPARLRAQGAWAIWKAEAFDWVFSSGCSGAGVDSTIGNSAPLTRGD